MDTTELTLVTGDRYEIAGSIEDVEAALIAASRGSIMQLAWLTERGSDYAIGINPAAIVSLRGLPPATGPGPA